MALKGVWLASTQNPAIVIQGMLSEQSLAYVAMLAAEDEPRESVVKRK